MSLKIGKSDIDGQGIFTENMISEGATFYCVPLDSVSLAPKSHYAHIGNNRYVNDEAVLNWVNHSCSANAHLDISSDQPVLIALRNIEPDEEITCDYNETEKGGVKVVCTCGSERCRGYFLRIE